MDSEGDARDTQCVYFYRGRDPPVGTAAAATKRRSRVRGADLMADHRNEVKRVRQLLQTFNGPYSEFVR